MFITKISNRFPEKLKGYQKNEGFEFAHLS